MVCLWGHYYDALTTYEAITMRTCKAVRYQCIQLQVVTVSKMHSAENAFCFQFKEKKRRKSVDFAWACLSDPPFTDHLPFMTVFASPRGDHKKEFLLYMRIDVPVFTFCCLRLKSLQNTSQRYPYSNVSGFEKRGHFGPDLDFEILISSESIGNQLSFNAWFSFIAAWVHFLCAYI